MPLGSVLGNAASGGRGAGPGPRWASWPGSRGALGSPELQPLGRAVNSPCPREVPSPLGSDASKHPGPERPTTLSPWQALPKACPPSSSVASPRDAARRAECCCPRRPMFCWINGNCFVCRFTVSPKPGRSSRWDCSVAPPRLLGRPHPGCVGPSATPRGGQAARSSAPRTPTSCFQC